MAKSKRRAAGLERRKPFREPRKLFLLVCGGSKTEPSYFEGLREKYRKRLIRLDVVPNSRAPLAIVKRAIDLKSEAEQQPDAFEHYDHVWCVFDNDDFQLSEAVTLAGQNKVDIALSNPCFELWLVLHFQDQSAQISTKQVQELCQKLIPNYKKYVEINKIWSRHHQAVRRAKVLTERHVKRGQPRANPSTEIHRIIEQIEESQWRVPKLSPGSTRRH